MYIVWITVNHTFFSRARCSLPTIKQKARNYLDIHATHTTDLMNLMRTYFCFVMGYETKLMLGNLSHIKIFLKIPPSCWLRISAAGERLLLVFCRIRQRLHEGNCWVMILGDGMCGKNGVKQTYYCGRFLRKEIIQEILRFTFVTSGYSFTSCVYTTCITKTRSYVHRLSRNILFRRYFCDTLEKRPLYLLSEQWETELHCSYIMTD